MAGQKGQTLVHSEQPLCGTQDSDEQEGAARSEVDTHRGHARYSRPAPQAADSAQRCTLTDDERAALVERMLPAYRVLLRSGDQVPVQDKGDTVHTPVS